MPDAPGQSSNGNTGGSNEPAGGAQGDGGGANTQQNQSQNTNQSAQFDPTALSREQLNQILEKNPEIWKVERLAELRDKSSKYDKVESEKTEAEKKALEEQGKFKELNEKVSSENATLKEQIKALTTNQQLTTKLAPLGVVDLDAALKLVDRSKITIGDDGTITGIDEAIESLKTEKAYLFNANGSTQQVGSNTNSNNGQGNSNVATFKRSQLNDPKFYAENREAILKAAAAGQIEDDLQPPK